MRFLSWRPGQVFSRRVCADCPEPSGTRRPARVGCHLATGLRRLSVLRRTGAALALGLFAAAGLATEAQAQSSVLVSNTGQNADNAGDLGQNRAQAFTTGNNSVGYVLTSVDAVLRNLSTMGCPDLAVTIQNNSGGSPGTVVGTLTNPDNCEQTAGDHTLTFTAPGEGLELAANAAYFIVFKADSSASEQIVITNSGAEDAGGASGWSIGNNRLFGLFGGGWGTSSNSAYKIAVKGEAKTPGVTVTPAALEVAKGATATYDIVLNTAPTGDVVITPTSSATAKATASPATLTFTTTNWNQAQQVTVNGAAAGSASISHQVTTSADTTNYPTSMSIDSVAVTVNAMPSVTVNLNLSGGQFDEGDTGDAVGLTAGYTAFSVSASSDVPEDIEVQVCFSGTATLDTTGATPITTGDYQVWIEATTTLLFIPQIVMDSLRSRCLSAKIYKEFQTGDRTQNNLFSYAGTALGDKPATYRLGIRRQGDTVVEPDETVIATLSLVNPPAGVTLGKSSATFTIRNDDTAMAGVDVSADALTVAEGATSAYEVRLGAAPTGNVVITPSSSAGTTATVSPATLTFTASNWNEAQKVTVSGVAAGSASISHQVTTTADATNYPTSTSIDPVAVTVTEPPLAVTLSAPDTLAQEWNAANPAQIKLTLGRGLKTGESLEVPLIFTGGKPGQDFDLALEGSPNGVTLTRTLDGKVIFTGGDPVSAMAVTLKLTAKKDADTIHEQVMVSIPASSSTGGDATLTATGLPGGATGSGSATITLRDDVGRTISWEKTAVTVNESADLPNSDDPALVLSEPYAADSAANQENPTVYGCVGGTATNKQDYDANNKWICSDGGRVETLFPAGLGVTKANLGLTVSAAKHNDAIDEPDETVTFTLLEDEIPVTNPVSLSGSDTYTLTIRDDDPTVVSLARVGSGAVTEGGTAEFTVTLGRALVAGEIIDVPLSVSGTGVTTDDWSLLLKTGTGLNTGVALSGETTATPSLRFSGAAAETARLVLTAVVDGVAEDGGETLSVALGPDDATANGFDRTSLATNVGGGADPDTGANAFTLTVNEAAELGVTVTPASLSVAEAGGTGSYTVVLDRPPSHDVVIAVASGDTNIATVSPPTLTFSTTDWDSPQPVTVTGVDDDVDQSTDRVVTVGHTVTSSDNNYNGLVAPVVSVTVTDDDNVFDIVLSRSSLGVGEGQSVTYTVRLEGSQQPTHNVMVSVTSEDTGVATVSTANGDGTLTFTPSDFQNAQTVTVTGVDDSLAQSSPRMVDLSHSATSTDPVYNAIPDKEIAVSVSDTALPVVTFAAEIVTVEEGETGSFVVTRTGDTSAALTVLLDVSIVEDFSETVKLITEEQRGHQELIIPAEQSSATYVVQTVDDAYVEPTGFAKLALRGADTYLPGKTDTAVLISLDNDYNPAVTVSGGAAVVEGTDAVFTLSTDIAQSFDLTVNLSVADDGTSDFVAVGNEGDKTVTIPANQTSATYTVATEADSTDEANGVVSVTVANGDNYFPGTPDMASVTVQDDDGTVVPVLSVAAKAFKGQSLKEGQIAYEEVAGSAEFIASLTPSGSSSLTVCVRVTETIEDRVSSSNEGIRTLSIPANSGDYGFQVPWADNATDEADSVVTVEAVAPETAGCSASAGAYTVSASEASDRVRIVDDEATTASLVRDGTGAVDEGDTITFELGFDRALVAGEKIVAPFSISGTGVTTSDFTLSLKSGDGINTGVSLSGETTLMPQLTFSGAGAGPAVLELVPVMDATAESGGSETFAIQLGRGTSLSVGSNLGGGVARHGTNNGFTVMVNDLVTPEITITGGSAVTEGTGAEFTVTASPAPSADLTVRLIVADDDTSDFVASTNEGDKSVIIQSGTASATYTIATTADSIDEADGAVRVTVKADPAYTLDGPVTDTVSVSDDDEAALVFAQAADPLEVSEGGSAAYTVALATQPTGTVTVTLTQPTNTDVTVDTDTVTSNNQTTLSFTTANWNAPQTVTVAAAQDVDAAGDSADILHSASGGGYASVTGTVSVTVTDDDEAPTDTTAPTVTSIARQVPLTSPTNANSLTWRVTFDEAVVNVDAGDFEITGTTATLAVAQGSDATIWDVTASGGDLENLNGMVTLGFASDQNITDRAGNGLDTTATPSPNDNSYEVDNTAPRVAVSGVPAASTAAFDVTFTFDETVTGFDVGDITVGNGAASALTVSTAGTVWTATVTPTATGTVTVDVAAGAATDAAGNPSAAAAQASSTYTAPNTAPTGANGTVTTDEDTAYTFTAADFGFSDADPGDTLSGVKITALESAGALALDGTDVTAGQVIAKADIDANKLTFTPAADANGSPYATFGFKVNDGRDDSADAYTLTINVTAINDAPTGKPAISGTATQGQTLTATAGDIADPDGLPTTPFLTGYTFQWKRGGTDITGAMSQTYALAQADVGQRISIAVGYTDGGGTTESVTSLPTPTVANVNDAPVVANPIPDQSATAGTAFSYAFPAGTFSDVDSGDTLTYSAAKSDDADLPPWLSFTPATRTFSGTPAAADAGLLMVKVTASDGNGGTVSDTFNIVVSNPLPEITITGGSAVTEGMGAEFTVTASPAPSADLTVRLTVADDDTSDFVASTDEGGKSVIIQSGTASATYTVATTADSIDETDGAVRVTVKADPAYTLDGPVTDTVTVTDDDEAGVAVTETGSGTTVSEDGTVTDSYQVVLTSEPTRDVTIAVTSDDTDVATVDSDTLTFTSGNWNQPQSVTVTGADDAVDQSADRTVSISHVAASEDPNYERIEIDGVDVTVLDDDMPAIGFEEPVSRTRETAGQHAIALSLDPVPGQNITLAYSIGVESTATQDSDFTIVNAGRVSVLAGASRALLPLGIVDDTLVEGDETVILTLENGSDYSPGEASQHVLTITDDDNALAERVVRPALTRFGRTVGEQVLDAVTDRLGADRTVGFEGRLAGEALPRVTRAPEGWRPAGTAEDGSGTRALDSTEIGWDQPGAAPGSHEDGSGEAAPRDLNIGPVGSDGASFETFRAWLSGERKEEDTTRALTGTDFVTGTSFALTSETENGAALAFWGRGAQSGFSGRAGDLGLEGEVTSFMLGADQARDDWLFGLMLSRSRGEIDYTLGAASGEMETDLTALVPYMGWDVSDRLSVWGAAGLGSGDMRLRPEDGSEFRTDIDWGMAAAGADGALGSVAALGGAELRWLADALWTRTTSDAVPGLEATSGSTTRLRLGLESRWEHSFASAATLSPRLETGLRYDGGDAETGFGLEVGGGVEFTDPSRGLSLGLRGRTLALHQDGNFEDWGLALDLAYDPTPETKRGFAARLSHTFGGASSGGVDALLGPRLFPEASPTGDGDRSWSVEAAYGVSRGRGRVGSPYTTITAAGSGSATGARLGYRIEPDADHAADVNLDFWTEPPTTANDRASGGATLQWKW